MSAHEILIAVMAGFAVLGALDRIIGNKFGLGKEFEEGILAMGVFWEAVCWQYGSSCGSAAAGRKCWPI